MEHHTFSIRVKRCTDSGADDTIGDIRRMAESLARAARDPNADRRCCGADD